MVLSTVQTTLSRPSGPNMHSKKSPKGPNAAVPTVAEIRLSLPNKHHFEVDMSPFGLDGLPDGGTVFYAADRPYGLIEGTVLRDDAPPAPPDLAW